MSTKNINFDMKKGKKNEKRIEKLIEYQIGSLDKTITRKKKQKSSMKSHKSTKIHQKDLEDKKNNTTLR